ncbi:MAG: hypothetical protein A2096_05085 [Spirochaetes bacterium GWF1_41_5]|nr:MAG: hypothetical protein A2096_05085 [Spirochaetes bacterium GWF1_41_5]HBE01539.1 hypothetical protein [Spirochaetia bacterium]
MKMVFVFIAVFFTLLQAQFSGTIDIVSAEKAISNYNYQIEMNNKIITYLKDVNTQKKAIFDKSVTLLKKGQDLLARIQKELDILHENWRTCPDYKLKNDLTGTILKMQDAYAKANNKNGEHNINMINSKRIIEANEARIKKLTEENEFYQFNNDALAKRIDYTKKFRSDMEGKIGSGGSLISEADNFIKE